METSLSPDFRDLLSAFAGAGVRYMIVGGYAVGFHSRPRSTKDIDLWIARDDDNLTRLGRALTTFGAPPAILEALRSLRPDEILYMGRPPVRVDILQTLPGVDFEPAYARRVEADWDGVKVSIVGLDDLLANKRAVGRDQDRRDVRALERARKDEDRRRRR
jgi:predicted nucleotidyltransferase